MALWKEKLSPGSYKGAPFYLESHEFEGGKRIADHIFPYRDIAWTESLGLKQRIFNLDVYVLGDDYFPLRDNLIKALESPGSGILVHPYLGEKTVECDSFTVSESKTEGGYVGFSITFKETGRKPGPETFVDGRFALSAISKDLETNLIDDMVKKFDASNLSELGLGRAVKMVDDVSNKIQTVANSFPGNLGVAELGYSLRVLKSTIRDLLRTPMLLAKSTAEAISGLAGALSLSGLNPFDENQSPSAQQDIVIEGRTQRASLKPLIEFSSSLPLITGDTPARVQERENTRVYGNLVKAGAIGNLAVISAGSTYATFQEAIDQRDYLVSEIEALLNQPGISDPTYESLMDLLAATVRSIPGEFSEENRISIIPVAEASPSLVLTYELYGNLALEQDIILRNRVKNPAFVPAGRIEAIAGD